MKKIKNLVIGAVTVSLLAAGAVKLIKKNTKEEKELNFDDIELRRVVYYNSGEIVYSYDEVGKYTLGSIPNINDVYYTEETMTDDYMVVCTYKDGFVTNSEVVPNKYKKLTK